ncbi:hypothetical protein B4110_3035 [Parageobacillus toebii]|uniref:Uncharacterized protein n=1 Tax=Parageobacillus toebii TaxID=153151 RepID=A0A150MXQ4_9BACL|nr:hypothetical protein B4110_3035 [Parageobacillus toebii]
MIFIKGLHLDSFQRNGYFFKKKKRGFFTAPCDETVQVRLY